MNERRTIQPAAIHDAATALLTDLCSISSESGNAAGIRQVGERLGTELASRGFTIEIRELPGAGDAPLPVLHARTPMTGGPRLLLVGHLDTVLPASPPRLDGRRLFASGALDMKAGFAMFVAALDMLAARRDGPLVDVELLGVPDEESGSRVSAAAVREASRGVRALLVLEPGGVTGGKETLVAGRRGMTDWTLEATGRPSHSGLAFWSGRSALAAAADWSRRAHALSRPEHGPTVNVARLLAGTAAFVDRLETSHTLFGTARHRNVVPDRARAEGEVRYLSESEGKEVLATLARLAHEIGRENEIDLRFTTGGSIAPVDPRGPGVRLVERTMELAAARGFELVVEEDRGGISFPNYLEDPGRIAVLDGLGPVGDGMHTREEWVDLDSLRRRIVLLADLLMILAD